MTVYISLGGVDFLVSGVKHGKRFDAHSVYIMGYASDCRALFNGHALELLDEAAAEAADEPEPAIAPLSVELAEEEGTQYPDCCTMDAEGGTS